MDILLFLFTQAWNPPGIPYLFSCLCVFPDVYSRDPDHFVRRDLPIVLFCNCFLYVYSIINVLTKFSIEIFDTPLPRRSAGPYEEVRANLRRPSGAMVGTV